MNCRRGASVVPRAASLWRFVRISVILIGTFLLSPFSEPVVGREELSASAVNQAIERGVAYLRRQQGERGNWEEYGNQPTGTTSLGVMALLNAGIPKSDPSVVKALEYIRAAENPAATYATSLQIMAFALAEPDRDRLLIRRNVKWLADNQVLKGNDVGGWSYVANPISADNSNTQFALLALHEAELLGVRSDPELWKRGLKYWLDQQRRDGSWSYRPMDSSGSMTCAGIASVLIAIRHLPAGDAAVINGDIVCCGRPVREDAAARGLDWLGKHFSVTRNPAPSGPDSTSHYMYYMYGLERVGRLSGQRYVGRHDWYREGAEQLLLSQNKLDGSWYCPSLQTRSISTAMALLFLSKGKRPVAISKLQHSTELDWNYHPDDIAQLTQHLEQRWKQPLNWQYISSSAASAADLLQSPVLFISGREGLRLSAAEKTALRDYCLGGGFIFAEACCGGEGFDRDFRGLMEELFPDTPLRLLPPDHPVWFAEQAVDPDAALPLFGINTCCRTSVVYCPDNLGCLWELSRRQGTQYPPEVRRRLDTALAMGANVVAYATGRELRDKLDALEPVAAQEDDSLFRRGALSIAKLQHGGGSDDAPAALANLLAACNRQLGFQVAAQPPLLSPADPSLPDYPLAFMHGRQDFHFSQEDRRKLTDFIQHGGVIFGDAICSSTPFAEAFRRELQLLLPDKSWRKIPPDHPLYSEDYHGFKLPEVTLRSPRTRQEGEPLGADLEKITPVLEGLELEGRFVVIFSPYDLSCAMENHTTFDCRGYVREDAARLGINIILYALSP